MKGEVRIFTCLREFNFLWIPKISHSSKLPVEAIYLLKGFVNYKGFILLISKIQKRVTVYWKWTTHYCSINLKRISFWKRKKTRKEAQLVLLCGNDKTHSGSRVFLSSSRNHITHVISVTFDVRRMKLFRERELFPHVTSIKLLRKWNWFLSKTANAESWTRRGTKLIGQFCKYHSLALAAGRQ